MKKFNAVIIGAGSIGGLKPHKYDNKKSKGILTIAHAFHKNKKINLMGFVDTEFTKAITAAKKWDCMAYESVSVANAEKEIDIVAICTPTPTHLEVAKEVIEKVKPKLILFEKPCGENFDQAKEMYDLCKKNNIIAVVDYIRRFDTAVQLLKESLEKTKVRSCVIRYGRGLKHEACHAIDLCNFLFGGIAKYEALAGVAYSDRDRSDPSVPVHAIYQNCDNVFFVPQNSEDYNIFEIDILTEDCRVRFIHNGLYMEVTQVEQEKTYGSYKSMGYERIVHKTELNKALLNLSNHIVDCLENGAEPICGLMDGAKVHSIIESL